MLKGCGFALVLLAALVGGYMVWLDQLIKRPESLIFGAIAGVVVFFCICAFWNAWQAWSDWSLISRSEFGPRLSDGYVTAVAGRIRPEGEPLTAPLTGEPCVICEYEIGRPEAPRKADEPDGRLSDYAGFMMTPAKIDTSFGEVRLLGYPQLEQVTEQSVVSKETIINARNLLETTEYEDYSGMKMVHLVHMLNGLWSDDDGMVEKHICLRNASPEEVLPDGIEINYMTITEVKADDSLRDYVDETDELDEPMTEEELEAMHHPLLTEKRVDAGEMVVVFGVYNARRRGLMPPAGNSHPSRLVIGTPEEVAAKSRSKMINYAVGGILVLLVVHLGIYYGNQLPELRKPAPAPVKAAWGEQVVGVLDRWLL